MRNLSWFHFHGKPITPARLVRSLRWHVHNRLQPVNAFRGVYTSFADAQRAAPRVKPLGYEAADSADWYLSKLDCVRHEDYPVLFWMREAFEDSRSVFEIGGHVGVAYYGYEHALTYPADLTWTIWDVPSVARAGEALARERGRKNIRFITNPEESDGADIVLAAGALQYVDAPCLAETVASFRVRPKHVLVNTTPVYDGPSFVTLQSIGSAYCAYRVFNREEFVRSLANVGYSLVATWQQARAFRVPRHPEKAFDTYTGFYFRG